MKMKRTLALCLVAGLAIAAGAVTLSTGCTKSDPAAAKGQKEQMAPRHQCPMHPEIVKDGSGDCPICGMKLVPIEEIGKGADASPATEETGTPGTPGLVPITIDATKRQLLGLTTIVVKRASFETSIRTTGRVAWDERRVHHVHTRYEAYVEEIEADYTGKYVRKGEVLVKVYSPELYATQKEYLLALAAARSTAGSALPSVARGGRDLVAAARERLLLWDISPADIDALERRGEPTRTLNIYAPISGFVTSRTAYHGMKVMPADTLFDIVDLSALWVIADVYEYELPRLSLGQAATMTLSYWPGRSWTGRVTYVAPAVDEATRTVKVRLEVANPKGELKPEMFASVTIHGRSRDVLVVPDDVLIDSGERKVVFLSPGEGQLVPREISVGDQSDGVVEVTAGLSEGDVVARGASFLVDSESRLKSALSAMGADPAPMGAKAPPAAPAAGSAAPPPAGHVH
ncbi:MAG: efflux RND transporter periplasmic adaptor subunit [Holophagales bacterium]|nr:efflux RND transporter periplasmic adaptor subunit [Holophagales bacterium]